MSDMHKDSISNWDDIGGFLEWPADSIGYDVELVDPGWNVITLSTAQHQRLTGPDVPSEVPSILRELARRAAREREVGDTTE